MNLFYYYYYSLLFMFSPCLDLFFSGGSINIDLTGPGKKPIAFSLSLKKKSWKIKTQGPHSGKYIYNYRLYGAYDSPYYLSLHHFTTHTTSLHGGKKRKIKREKELSRCFRMISELSVRTFPMCRCSIQIIHDLFRQPSGDNNSAFYPR